LGDAALRILSAANERSCLQRFFWVLLLLVHATAAVPVALAQQQVIVEDIQFVGNRRIPRDTLRARIFTRNGDVYNKDVLSRDFQALWNTEFFEDIWLEEEPSPNRPNAVILVFHLKERPTIRRIQYCSGQPRPAPEQCTPPVVSESDILERFKESKVGLSVESRFDPTRIKRAEVVLKQLLAERGRQFAVVRPFYERIQATNAVKLVFFIEEGPKVKVGKLTIEGNKAFSDRKIIRSMRHSRPYAIPMWLFDWNIMSKTFDRGKLAEDQEVGIRGLYQDNGYFQVLVKDPVLETVDTKGGFIPGPWPLLGKKSGKATNITIGIEEGELFKMGKLFIRSRDPDKPLTIRQDFLIKQFPIQPGDIFRAGKVRKALEDYKKLYGQFGFIDFVAEPDAEIDAAKREIALTLDFEEGKQFFVRRIEFQGNTTTRDKVIRREILLDEGDLFNKSYWEVSLLRLNQLDYFEPIKPEHTEIKRNLKEGSVDLLLKVKEKGKQSIGLTGGFSGITGSFIGLSYQTNNFLGRGETLTFSAEFGDRQRNFLFGYTQPFFMDRPISTGFTVFSSRYSFDQARETSILLGQSIQLDPATTQNYDQNSSGFTTFVSYPLRRFAFTRTGLTYSYSNISVTTFSQASQILFESVQFRSLSGPSAFQGIRSSKLVPTLSHNTIDSPLNPTQGKSFFVSLGFEGGPLGGNVNTLTQLVEAKYFRPINRKRNVIGLRFLAAFATGYGGLVLPPYNRFYLGGEDNVRGYDIRTITPVAFVPTSTVVPVSFLNPTVLDQNGNPVVQSIQVPVLDYVTTFPGGDTQGVLNAEYRIPLVGPVSMSIFLDVGITGAMRRDQLGLNTPGLESLRQQFPSATIPTYLDLAAGSNFRPRLSSGLEFVVQLPVVNAPFRIFWAYNFNRYTTVVAEPLGAYDLSDPIFQTLPQGVLVNQVQPQLDAIINAQARRLNYFEPLRTFRFTVSRTF
jgi:outer membrane protein insertion porin family